MSLPPNLSFTRFLFLIPRRDDEGFLGRLRAAGSAIVRGFFNDFEAEGPRDGQPHETMQFFVADGDVHPDSTIAAARYVVQITGKYRPRLVEVETDLRRRLGDSVAVTALEGADRAPRYTSAELHDYAYKRAALRRTGRQAPCAIILPLSAPALTVVAVFTFLGTWNDFFGPLIYLDDPDRFPLAVALATNYSRVGTQWNTLMAANLISIIPPLVVYFLA